MNQSISEEFREKFPCKQSGCDGNGTIAEHGCNGSSEDCDATCPVAVQCQYCFEIRFPMEAFIQSKISQAIAAERKELREVTEDTSDGYHTFKELYEFRKIYNAALFNEWASQAKYEVHKSKRHGDGEECFGGGWFIVMATLPSGQISNHYELKDWDLFRCEEREKADQWDGHTPQDVIQRLQSLNK